MRSLDRRAIFVIGASGGIGGQTARRLVEAGAEVIAIGRAGEALETITNVLALELGKYNIRVNVVNPTVVMTPMSAWCWGRPDIGPPLLEKMPLGPWATENDIAGPIIFLLSTASMITGVSLSIDGGYTCV